MYAWSKSLNFWSCGTGLKIDALGLSYAPRSRGDGPLYRVTRAEHVLQIPALLGCLCGG